MCGICGVFANGKADADIVRRMTGALRHRGPDAEGVYIDQAVGLGHTRLSIIDLAGGAQPMQTEDGSLSLTFNGEIFNYLELREELIAKGHKFATRSDTEVILHMYREEGERCVERFNGQWAFALWDRTKQKLFLSRDRMGVRPLFYARTREGFVFASEIKALLASGQVAADLDREALDQIFTFWVPLPPRTAFRNIFQLPPGHSMVFQEGNLRIFRYWDLDLSAETPMAGADPAELADELLRLMGEAVRIRLRSDVPVGAYLSGGLDSTFIAALAKRTVGDRLRTFSVSFKEKEFDEREYQQEASRFIGTEHSVVDCSNEDIAGVFRDVVWHAEQPILRTAPAPLLMLARLVRDQGYKVVLTGEGADEVLGGYDIFKEAKIRRFWGRQPDSRWRPLLLSRLYPYMEGIQKQPTDYLKRFFNVGEEDLKSPFFSHLPRWALTAKLKLFFSDDMRQELSAASPLREMEESLPGNYRGLGSFAQAEYLEAKHLLPGYILSSQGDRMAMANSVEGRYPFLDKNVIEFAAKLPANLKMKVLDQKYLLKRASAGLIPGSIQKRFKQPYRAPDGKSFFNPSPDYVPDMLSEERIKRDGVFDPKAVGILVKKFVKGSQTSVKDNMALVGILSTEILLDRFQSRA